MSISVSLWDLMTIRCDCFLLNCPLMNLLDMKRATALKYIVLPRKEYEYIQRYTGGVVDKP